MILIIDYFFYYAYMLLIFNGLNFIARRFSDSKAFKFSKVDIYVIGIVSFLVYIYIHAGVKYFVVDDFGWVVGG